MLQSRPANSARFGLWQVHRPRRAVRKICHPARVACEELRLQIGEISDDLCRRIDLARREQHARVRLGGEHRIQRWPGLHCREDLGRVLDEHLDKAEIEGLATASPNNSGGCRRLLGALKLLDVVGEMRDPRRK
jgi:hypothetical protein